MPGVLACDPGTAAFGWSYFAGDGSKPEWGHQQLGVKGDSMGQVGAALTIFLEARIAAFHPKYIVYEKPYVPLAGSKIPFNPKVIERLYGLAGIIQTVAELHGIDSRDATTQAFCRYFLGAPPPKGRPAKKAAVVEMCRAMSWEPVTEDEADSLALGAYAEAILLRSRDRRPAGPLFLRSA